MVKAISLWEPWASLIRTGAKTYETRSWWTSYRGPLLICAAKTREYDYMVCNADFQKGLQKLFWNVTDMKFPVQIKEEHLNFGKAVALVELIRCEPTESLSFADFSKEEMFGNYSPGRFAWKLRMIKNDFKPFPVKGSQGLFEVDYEIKVHGGLPDDKQ